MVNLSDTINYTLLTQNHNKRDSLFHSIRRPIIEWWVSTKLLIIPNVSTKMENQMTYKRIIHKHYKL